MRAASRSSERGFTVIEALISLTIFLAVLTAVLTTYTPSKRIYARGERKAEVQQNARLAMGEMTRRIRMAGYFPENFASPAPGTPEANPIRVATNRALAIYGAADGSNASSVLVFCRSGSSLRLNTGAVGTAATYNCAGQRLAENVTDLRFVYYDANGNPIPSPPNTPFQLDNQAMGAVPNMTTTTQRAAVRRILVALTTQVQAPGQPHTFTLTSDIWLRNSQ